MIDIERRIYLAQKIRQLYARTISSGRFDDEIMEFFDINSGKIKDIAIFEIFYIMWTLYSDFSDTDMKVLAETKKTKKMLARAVLFLYSDMLYDKKYFSISKIKRCYLRLFAPQRAWVYQRRFVYWPFTIEQYRAISPKRSRKF